MLAPQTGAKVSGQKAGRGKERGGGRGAGAGAGGTVEFLLLMGQGGRAKSAVASAEGSLVLSASGSWAAAVEN